MTSAETPVPVPSVPDFAGMLAGFADPEKKFSASAEFDGLDDDVASLSYESALRGLERVAAKAAELADAAQPGSLSEEHEVAGHAKPLASDRAPGWPVKAEPVRKAASVTVRMSHAESEMLRERAMEAGITVSAYLRSCAFEVESLRAQVKETVAQLRAAAAMAAAPRREEPQPAVAAPPRPEPRHEPRPERQGWWTRFTPPARSRSATA